MIITPQQCREMLEAAKPLMKWMSENCHLHCAANVSSTQVVLGEAIASRHTNEFLCEGDSHEPVQGHISNPESFPSHGA